MTQDDTDILDRILTNYAQFGGDDRSDADLVHWVADRVQVPRADPADSFVLHAPLEVLARVALLPWVATPVRRTARLRLVAIAVQFEERPTIEEVAPEVEVIAPEVAARHLVAALAAGDLEATDRAAAVLSASAPSPGLTALVGDALLPSLAAAGHAPIFLYQLPRVSPRGEATPALIRPLAREIGRHPELRLEWIGDRPRAGGSAAALADAFASVPQLGVPGRMFIAPIMRQVDVGVAPDLVGAAVGGVTPADARPVILRTAARLMIMGASEHAPFGWSHALTMSQAALEISPNLKDPSLGVAVAATYLVGFLAALPTEPIRAVLDLERPAGDFAAALRAGRRAAAGWVMHAPESELGAMRADIVTRAVARRDAHLVKYTLACLDAMTSDPGAGRLYLAAAAALLAFWGSIVEADDPLRGVCRLVP